MGAFLAVLKTVGGFLASGAGSALLSAAQTAISGLASAAKLAGSYLAGSNAAKTADTLQAEGAFDEAASNVAKAESSASADRAAVIDRLRNGAGL